MRSTKKWVSLALAVVMTAGLMTVPAQATSNVVQQLDSGVGGILGLSNSVIKSEKFTYEAFVPGTTFYMNGQAIEENPGQNMPYEVTLYSVPVGTEISVVKVAVYGVNYKFFRTVKLPESKVLNRNLAQSYNIDEVNTFTIPDDGIYCVGMDPDGGSGYVSELWFKGVNTNKTEVPAQAASNSKTFTLQSGDSMTIYNYVEEKTEEITLNNERQTMTYYLVNDSTKVTFDVKSGDVYGDVSSCEYTDGQYSESSNFYLGGEYGWEERKATDLLRSGVSDGDTLVYTDYPMAGVSISNPKISHKTEYGYVVDDVVSLYVRPATQTSGQTGKSFTDVASDAYYAEAVKWAVDKGITAGTSTTKFSPDATCTNSQILTFLWRANGQPEPSIANPFSDVKTSDYYYKAALWASEKGLIAGTTLGADTPCTRSMVVTYLWKLAGQPEATKATSFTDVDSNADYAKAVAWAVEQGITSGTSATTFAPDGICTRGQIVTFLFRAMGK